jgi:proteasome lid subunit RPN8/RPN11
MTSFTHRSIRAFVGRRSHVRVTCGQWRELIAELGRRAAGVREAGAFLLADIGDRSTTVRRVVFFDDVDPACLTGGISMSSSAFGDLWRICSAAGLRVVADVHTHPGAFVDQSDIDRANPMVARAGHVAIIVPDLAVRPVKPTECGLHLYRGHHQWHKSFGRDAARVLYVGRWA